MRRAASASTVTIAFSEALCVLIRNRYSSTNSALDTSPAASAASCSVAVSQAKSSGAKEDTVISFYWWKWPEAQSVYRSVYWLSSTVVDRMVYCKSCEYAERLTSATATLMQRHGVAGTGIAEILSTSGVTRRSIYLNFPGGKAELVAAATRSAGDELTTTLRDCIGQPDPIGAFTGVWSEILISTDFEVAARSWRRRSVAMKPPRPRALPPMCSPNGVNC